jgi:alpha-tubulin suppressor-like RCC1 family protein
LPAGLAEVIAVSANGRHALALKADGSVVGWGGNVAAQVILPAAARGAARAVAAGATHSLVLHTDGTVTAWGTNDFGQATVPADLDDATGIAAGGRHSLAIRADGSVVAWGDNTSGQTAVPADLDLAASVAAGDAASLAVTDATPFAPLAIEAGPEATSVTAGGTATFSVTASGYPVPTYRWQISTDAGESWSDLADDSIYEGTATSVLTIAAVPAQLGGARFRCRATNAIDGTIVSSAALLTVNAAE